ncbi:hypothetical protein BGX26_005622 [Mortierella sp. AD094]|nr:hypothetical protein BGX26_005622 [Mortierella sp. AD094]
MSAKRRKLDFHFHSIDYLIEFFKDPPNAHELMDETRHAQSTASSSDNRSAQPPNSGDANAPNASVKKKPFRGLQLEFGGGSTEIKDTNREKVFIATVYLKRKLSDLIRGRGRLDRNAVKKNSKVFIDMAKELSQQEPLLEGVTSIALFALYARVVEYRLKLETELTLWELEEGLTYQWTPTLFYETSSELLEIDTRIDDANRGRDEINDETQEVSAELGLSPSSSPRNEESLPTQPTQRADSPPAAPIRLPTSSSLSSSSNALALSTLALPSYPLHSKTATAMQPSDIQSDSDTPPPPSRHSTDPPDDIQPPSPGIEDRSREDSPIPSNSQTDRMHDSEHAHQTNYNKETGVSADTLTEQDCPLDDFVRALCDQEKITRSNIEDLQKKNKSLREKVDTSIETIKGLEKVVHELKKTVKNLEEAQARVAEGQSRQEAANTLTSLQMQTQTPLPRHSSPTSNSSHNNSDNTPDTATVRGNQQTRTQSQ